MSRADLDLKLAALAAALGLVAGLAIETPAIRLVPAALLVLGVPGYALSVALFPGPRDAAERALLALGLSFSIDVLTGLVLDRTGWGLTARSWSLALALLTFAFLAVGSARRRSGATDRGAGPRTPRPGLRLRPATLVGACAALALVVGAVLIARLPASDAHVRGYTLLWALPLRPNAGTFEVGVKSDELKTASYRLAARSNGKVVLGRRFTLRPGQTWKAQGRVKATPGSFGETLQVVLYRDGQRSPYRHVFLSFPGPA